MAQSNLSASAELFGAMTNQRIRGMALKLSIVDFSQPYKPKPN